MEKETGQYFKAKTYKHDGRYCTSLLLIVWCPNGLYAILCILCLIHKFPHLKGNCVEYASGCPPVSRITVTAFLKENIPHGLSHCLNSILKLDDQWQDCTKNISPRLTYLSVLFYFQGTTFWKKKKKETENYKISVRLLETHTYIECKCQVQSIGFICSSLLAKCHRLIYLCPTEN